MNYTLPAVPNFSAPKYTPATFSPPAKKATDTSKDPSPQELDQYKSASSFISAIASDAMQWKNQLPTHFKPAIIAILYGGMQIQVTSLAKVSFHGIRIEGTMNGSPCSLLAHQSTVQILCHAEEIVDPIQKNPIGFIWDTHNVEV